MVKPLPMNRRVNNPFKEKQNVFIRYALLLSIALGLTILLVVSRGLSRTRGLDANHGSVRLDSVPQVIVTDDENSKADLEDDAQGIGGEDEEDEEDKEDNSDEDNDDADSQGDSGTDKDDEEEEGGEEEEEEESKEKKDELMNGFSHIEQEQFGGWVHKYLRRLQWPETTQKKKDDTTTGLSLNREILLESLRLGCTNMVENQHTEGNFNYQYNFVKKRLDEDDSDVRQAGALWGISLCYQFDPSNQQYKKAVEKAIRFFTSHSVPGSKEGTLAVRYPNNNAPMSSTGTNALFGLGMVEYLRTVATNGGETNAEQDEEFIQQVRMTVKGIIGHLVDMQLPNQHFGQSYKFDGKEKSPRFSPYYDGEAMLCLVKAAKYLEGFGHLIPVIEGAAPVLAKAYSIDVWASDRHDSDETKGFYQWSSMFLTEYYQSGWKNAATFGDFVLLLSHWVIHTHEILLRTKNTGYAFEGIISAYEIAKHRQDEATLRRLEAVIDQGLHKLCTWQVGGPLAHENPYLVKNPTSEKIAVGGIMGASNEADLRIDTTQHQMHALIMALTTVYTK